MLAQLHEKEAERIAIGFAAVHGVPDLTGTAHSSYDVNVGQTRVGSHLVMLGFGDPASLPVICESDHGLINVHDFET